MARRRSPPVPIHPFEAAVARFCRKERLLRDGDRVVVAFSGGPDSTALLLALHALSRGPGLRLRLVAAHLDHGLRRGSREDARAARRVARALGVPFRSRRARGIAAGGGGSLEQASRRARYAFLASVARKSRAQKVAVAHHLDDRAETVLHRLLQGSTLRGLAGIPLRRPLPGAPSCEVVRPLFEQDRASTLAYLRDRGASFSEDPTNSKGPNARARLRGSVLPAILAAYPQAPGSLLRLADLAREASCILDRSMPGGPAWLPTPDGAASIPRSAFRGRAEEGLRRLLGRGLEALGCPRTSPPLAAVRRLAETLAALDGRRRRIPILKGWEAEVGAGGVLLRRGP